MKIILLILLSVSIGYSQTIKKQKGVNIIIIDDDQTTPPPDTVIIPCEKCEDGKTPVVKVGTTSTLPAGSSATVIGVPTTDGILLNFGIPQGPPGVCPSCPGTGGTTLRSVYFLSDYTNGDDGNMDTQGVQNFFNAVVANKGYGMIPPPGNAYLLDNTITIQPAGNGQVWAEFHAWGNGGSGDIFRYVGPSNKAVFLAKGLKNVIMTGFKVAIASGRDHVTIMDLDGDNGAPSIGFVTFKNHYYNLSSGQYNVGTRIGHLIGTFPNSNGDISNVQWENCTTFGGGNVNTSIPGQIAYLHEGRNSLSFTWFGGFGAFLESVYSNKSGPGAQFDRGNGSVFFKGYGTSQNEVNYVVAFEQGYEFEGGRHESSRKFLKVIDGGNASITVKGAEIGDFKTADGSIFDLQRATTLTIEGCNLSKAGTKFDKMVNLTGNGNFGTVSIRNCAIGAENGNIVKKTSGTTQWRIYIQGCNRLPASPGVFTDGFLADVNGQVL